MNQVNRYGIFVLLLLLSSLPAARAQSRSDEFQPDGMVTGIITMSKLDSSTGGTWFSPKSRKQFPISLQSAIPADMEVVTEFSALTRPWKGYF